MKATRFMRITFFASGFKVTEDNMDAIARWCGGHVVRDTTRPFVYVPVFRPTSRNQAHAYLDMWVIHTIHRGRPSYKVYAEEWLNQNFVVVPDEAELSLDSLSEAVMNTDDEETQGSVSCAGGHCCGGQPTNNVRSLPTQSTGSAKPTLFVAPTAP